MVGKCGDALSGELRDVCNAMAALAHPFPRLRRVGLTNVDFTSKNYALFRRQSSSSLSDKESLNAFAEICALHGIDFEEAMCHRILGNGVEYTGIYPIPELQSFYVNNHSSQYAELDLVLLDGWFPSSGAATTLRSLELSAGVEFFSVADFINDIGSSPVLEHLRLWVGCRVGSCKSLLC